MILKPSTRNDVISKQSFSQLASSSQWVNLRLIEEWNKYEIFHIFISTAMKTLAFLLVFVFVASASAGCYSANWWSLLDKTTDTWATCDLSKKAKYITGLWRSANGGASDERVGRLEEARCCCPASSYLATADADCVNANWWSSFNQ